MAGNDYEIPYELDVEQDAASSQSVISIEQLQRLVRALTIRVDAIDEGKPSRLSVQLDEPLESKDLTFLAWDGERLRHLTGE